MFLKLSLFNSCSLKENTYYFVEEINSSSLRDWKIQEYSSAYPDIKNQYIKNITLYNFKLYNFRSVLGLSSACSLWTYLKRQWHEIFDLYFLAITFFWSHYRWRFWMCSNFCYVIRKWMESWCRKHREVNCEETIWRQCN